VSAAATHQVQQRQRRGRIDSWRLGGWLFLLVLLLFATLPMAWMLLT